MQEFIGGLHICPAGQLSVPLHVPAAQTSPLVQASPSSHGLVLFRCRQVYDWQTSVVHGLASRQSGSDEHSTAGPERTLRKSQVAGNGAAAPREVDRIPTASPGGPASHEAGIVAAPPRDSTGPGTLPVVAMNTGVTAWATGSIVRYRSIQSGPGSVTETWGRLMSGPPSSCPNCTPVPPWSDPTTTFT